MRKNPHKWDLGYEFANGIEEKDQSIESLLIAWEDRKDKIEESARIKRALKSTRSSILLQSLQYLHVI